MLDASWSTQPELSIESCVWNLLSVVVSSYINFEGGVGCRSNGFVYLAQK